MICPNCGASVPEKAKACRECGSDDRTGWSRSTADLLPSEPLPEPRTGSHVAVAFGTLALFAIVYVAAGLALLLATVAIAAVVYGTWFVRRSAPMVERRLMRELALRARGDADLPRRLVESELARRPGISRVKAVELALARLEHDRR